MACKYKYNNQWYSKAELTNKFQNENKDFQTLYTNFLKELENNEYGKEVLNRVKKEYVYKNKSDATIEWFLDENTKSKFKIITKKGSFGSFNTKEEAEEALNKAQPKYTLEEQQEEALVQLLGELTAGKLQDKASQSFINLLKELLAQMTTYMRSLFNSKEIEIDKLDASMTLNDLANLLAYTNSKIILPGSKVEYTTPDNQKFSTYQEASNHISKLFSESKDIDLTGIKLKKDFNFKGLIDPISLKTIENVVYIEGDNAEFMEDENTWEPSSPGFFNVTFEDNTTKTYYDEDLLRNNKEVFDFYFKAISEKNTIDDFIKKNKPYEQGKKIIETWKKENNIIYNPEEVYSRGQGFYSAIGAYSTVELDLLLQNLLTHIEDNKKAGGSFDISAFTKPVDKKIGHLEGESSVRFVIFPKSEDIKWAAPMNVYSGSVWDASEKVSKNKKSELLGVSHTKAPSLQNVNEVSPNLASIIDERSHHHNELGIELTNTNFRLEFDDNVPYEIKQLVNSVNSILDEKYGKIVKPEINTRIDRNNISNVDIEIQTLSGNFIKDKSFNNIDEAELYAIDKWGKDWILNGKVKFNRSYGKGIQPTQTKQNTSSIGSVSNKIDERNKLIPDKFVTKGKDKGYSSDTWFYKENGEWYMKYVDFDKPFNTEVDSHDITKMSDAGLSIDEIWESYVKVNPEISEKLDEKEYTQQALTNTKIAKLKEVAKKYPRSLITSKVVNNSSSNEKQYQKSTEIKPGVSELYEENPELANIGTQEQYSQYLDTIFPDSKVKNIVYHGSKFSAKLYNKKPLIWFNDIPNNNEEAYFIYEDSYDIKDKVRLSYKQFEKLPSYRFESFKKRNHNRGGGDTFLGTGNYFTTSREDAIKGYKRDGGLYKVLINVKNPYTENAGYNNSMSGKGSQLLIDKGYDAVTEKINNGQEYNVFEPEQIHILGFKQDIQGFKDFVNNKEFQENNNKQNNDFNFVKDYNQETTSLKNDC